MTRRKHKYEVSVSTRDGLVTKSERVEGSAAAEAQERKYRDEERAGHRITVKDLSTGETRRTREIRYYLGSERRYLAALR